MPRNTRATASLIRNATTALKALATRRVEFGCDRIRYRFDGVPLKKLLNWILVEASARVRAPQPWGFPTILQVEPTNRCNLRCTLCPVAEGLERPAGQMELELFKSLIDQVGEYVFLILLWEWGEPFINPRIYEMISYAKQRGIKLVTSTNGHLFARKENAEKVVRSGLDTLIFALDGISQETYERYRRDGQLETVLQGIRNVVEAKKALGSKTPLINLRFIVMQHNEHEVGKLHELAESLGVVTPTSVTRDGQGAGQRVVVEFDKADASTLSDVTGKAIDKQLALLLKGKVLSAATVKDPITAGKVTFGFGTASEADQVAALLGASATS